MPMNRIQFQSGLSLPDFLHQFGTEAQCEVELEQARWPQSFVCPCCGHTAASVFRVGCTRPCSAKPATPNLADRRDAVRKRQAAAEPWFLAIYLISQAKTGLSALALKRLLGVSYPTASAAPAQAYGGHVRTRCHLSSQRQGRH